MNVLFLALDVDLTTQRGEAVHTRELARFLGARGVHVHLVTATPGERAPPLGPGVHHYTRPEGSDWSHVRFCALIGRHSRANVVYERRLSPKIAFAVSWLLGTPFIVEVNGIEEEAALQGRPSISPWRPLKVWMRRRMYQRAARVVAVADRLAERVRELHGLPPQRVVALPNGVDPERFVPVAEAGAQMRLGLATGTWITFVGNLVPWQGVETLLRAVPHVLAQHPFVRFAIVGDGLSREPLERLAHDLQVREAVTFVGTVLHETVPLYIGASRVCVAPFSRHRNEMIGLSPLKVYEYLSCARPVVASDVPGVRELLQVSGGGMSVPPDDPKALAAAICRMLADRKGGRMIGERGRRYAAAECSWARTAERIESVLTEALTRT